MDSDSSDSSEKQDRVPELRSAEDLANAKARGKRPVVTKKQKQSKKDGPAIDEVERKRLSLKDSPIKDAVAEITQKAKGITIKEPATSVASKYSLRSGPKGMGVYVASGSQSTKAANKKRKGEAQESDVYEGLEADTEEACKKLEGRKKDDDMDMDGAGAGAGRRITRASGRMKAQTVKSS